MLIPPVTTNVDLAYTFSPPLALKGGLALIVNVSSGYRSWTQRKEYILKRWTRPFINPDALLHKH